MDADFGYTHLVTDSEFENKNVPHEWTYAVDVGLTEQNLIADLAKLCWGLYLGGRLASMVELKERIKSAHVVRLFPDGSMYIQLTNSIFDIWKNYEGFNVQRTKAEQEFGSYLAVSDLIERLPLKLNISSITG